MQALSSFAAHSISAMALGSFLYTAVKETCYSNGEDSHSTKTDEAKEHEQLLKQENIRSDFSIRHTFSVGSNQVHGINYTAISDAAIHMWPGIKEADINAYYFLLLRQFYYLKISESAVSFFKSGGMGIVGFVVVYLTTNSPWLACITAVAISQITQIIQYRKSIDASDAFAIRHASDRQLEGGLRYLEALQKIRLIYAKNKMSSQLAERIADGNYFFSCQPCLKKRIGNVKQELTEKRKIKILRNFESEKAIGLLADTVQKSLKGNEQRSFDLI